MEKTLKVILNADRSIDLFLNENHKHNIEASKRSITAKEIYDIVEFSPGDQYHVVSENHGSTDQQVLDFFVKLFDDIFKQVNAIETS